LTRVDASQGCELFDYGADRDFSFHPAAARAQQCVSDKDMT
jgi:hypothetical protein